MQRIYEARVYREPSCLMYRCIECFVLQGRVIHEEFILSISQYTPSRLYFTVYSVGQVLDVLCTGNTLVQEGDIKGV